METTIYTITTLGKGSLSIMPRPDSADMRATFRAIKSFGTTHMVSLLEQSEAQTLGLADEAHWCEKFRIEFLHFPIADFSTPSNSEDFKAFTRTLHTLITQGAQCVIHCRGGVGRAGMTATSVLMHAGLSSQSAMQTVTDARGLSVPETDNQKAFIQKIERE